MRFSDSSRGWLRRATTAGAIGLAATAASISPIVASPASASPLRQANGVSITPEGLPQGAIKHVWLIILENKSYDATFTGLNANSYLWKTLPSQGVLLKNYYGTGHFSQDNYTALASGQGPSQDLQSDCGVQNFDLGSNSNVETTGTPNDTLAQDYVGTNLPNGSNGCTYPSNVPTLFNQFDSAGVTWKGYAQDLGGASANSPTVPNSTGATGGSTSLKPGSDVTNRDASACGGPGSSTNFPGAKVTTASLTGSTVTGSPSSYGVGSFGGAQPDDQYVAKHFPFPWFHSLIGTTGNGGPGTTSPAQGGYDCDSAHIANLDSPTTGLVHDLASETTTPAFSWISPNNCSDAHDAQCVGNNLSGAFDPSGNPIYNTSPQAYDPESTTPVNFTGGLYASDLFLRYYVPLIEQSAAFKDGGLIDVTFDEANPPFQSGSFYNDIATTGQGAVASGQPAFTAGGSTGSNGTTLPPACSTTAPVVEPCTPSYGASGTNVPGANSVYGAYGYFSDLAGQTIGGVPQQSEPTGPNDPQSTDSSGNQTGPGPGDNGFIDRTASTAARTDTVSAAAGSATVTDSAINASDTGRQVTDTTDAGFTAPAGGAFVGPVTNTGPVNSSKDNLTTSKTGTATGTFTLVDQNGNPITTEPALTKLTLTQAADPLLDTKDFTPGGGDVGSVLISPYITPGTSTTVYYNHYSWLRTMEDLFNVSSGTANTSNNPSIGVPVYDPTTGTLTSQTATVASGIDGLGHLGYAAQTNLTPFGADVFNNPSGQPGSALPESPIAAGLPIVGLLAGATYLGLRRRQRRQATPA